MKKTDIRDISVDRPSTFTESGERIFPHPAEVQGFYRKNRDFFYGILVLIFLALPWIKIGGGQALLIDIVERKFFIFGMRFWGHDMPMIFFVLAALTIGLAFVTSIWGRVWCGWACPQTVFIDFVYRRVEVWIEGNHLKRIKLDQAPWSTEKFLKKSLKWFAYFLISALISHSFIAYFVGADELVRMIGQAPQNNWSIFLFVFIIAAILTFNFGWFREQFCMIACPYGRFQSVLMDANSLAPLYDEQRGEPRGKKSKDSSEPQGDCVDCFRCVSVCPTRIDIRRGIQLECIGCTACIDACDEVMTKMKKETGLIRYATENELSGKKASFFRPRTVVYIILLIAVFSGLSLQLLQRKNLDMTFVRAIESPYQVIKEEVVNHFKVHGKNQSFENQKVELSISPELKKQGFVLIAPTYPTTVLPGKDMRNHIFIRFPKGKFKEKPEGAFKINLEIAVVGDSGEKKYFQKELTLVGPYL